MYFTCYASTLGTSIGNLQCQLIGYADDHSLYTSFKAGDEQDEVSAFARLSLALTNSKQWMLSNKLKMNDDKTEFVVIGSHRLLHKHNTESIAIGDSIVERSSSVKLLGVHLDQHLNLKMHISQKSRAAGLAMHNLIKLRPYLDKDTCLKLANALIFSHMDYCNSLYVDLPHTTLKPFTRIQNLTAKIILNQSKLSSSTEALKELHILPVHARADFKCCQWSISASMTLRHHIYLAC